MINGFCSYSHTHREELKYGRNLVTGSVCTSGTKLRWRFLRKPSSLILYFRSFSSYKKNLFHLFGVRKTFPSSSHFCVFFWPILSVWSVTSRKSETWATLNRNQITFIFLKKKRNMFGSQTQLLWFWFCLRGLEKPSLQVVKAVILCFFSLSGLTVTSQILFALKGYSTKWDRWESDFVDELVELWFYKDC